MSDYGDYRDVEQLRAQLAAKDAEIARLRSALEDARTWITNHYMRSKIDAALNGDDKARSE